jgi:uncharacterized protein (DUF924 family)
MIAHMIDHPEIIDFWFSEPVRRKWWAKDEAFDAEVQRRFATVHALARAEKLARWRAAPEGRLAEIIVLDQFSRNMFRHSHEAFAQDELARHLCREAVACGADLQLTPKERSFLYMPLMHSEALVDHEESMRLYASHPDLAFNLDFAGKHKAIIDRFGRYPHRNTLLGRESTAEELRFLQQPGSSF